MTLAMMIWALGGVILLQVGALVVVSIARKLDKRDGGPPTAVPDAFANAVPASLQGVLKAASERPATTASPGKTLGVAAAALSIAAAALVALLASLSDDNEASADLDASPAGDAQAYPVERELAAGELRGLLVTPSSEAPVILIVPGSGPTDRDGDNAFGIRAASYRLLADGLARNGVGSVRVDKHGMFSSKASGDANDVTVDSYAADYRNWIDVIRTETGQPCVWLLGHSEGALMVSAAAIGRDDVCGLILVAGMGRKLGPVLREQLASNPANAPLLDAANRAIDRIEAGERVDPQDLPMLLRPLFPEAVQGFLISAFAADPVEQVRLADVSTLVVQGTTDLQITLEDANLLAAAPKAELAIIDGMNHVLKVAPENRMANMAAYMNPDLPLAPGLAETIADFVREVR